MKNVKIPTSEYRIKYNRNIYVINCVPFALLYTFDHVECMHYCSIFWLTLRHYANNHWPALCTQYYIVYYTYKEVEILFRFSTSVSFWVEIESSWCFGREKIIISHFQKCCEKQEFLLKSSLSYKLITFWV